MRNLLSPEPNISQEFPGVAPELHASVLFFLFSIRHCERNFVWRLQSFRRHGQVTGVTALHSAYSYSMYICMYVC